MTLERVTGARIRGRARRISAPGPLSSRVRTRGEWYSSTATLDLRSGGLLPSRGHARVGFRSGSRWERSRQGLSPGLVSGPRTCRGVCPLVGLVIREILDVPFTLESTDISRLHNAPNTYSSRQCTSSSPRDTPFEEDSGARIGGEWGGAVVKGSEGQGRKNPLRGLYLWNFTHTNPRHWVKLSRLIDRVPSGLRHFEVSPVTVIEKGHFGGLSRVCGERHTQIPEKRHVLLKTHLCKIYE